MAPRDEEREVRVIQMHIAVWIASNYYRGTWASGQAVKGIRRVPWDTPGVQGLQH